MDRCLETEPLDLTFQLPRDIYYQVVHTLRTSLPPPVTSAAEDLIRRDNAAIAAVASLLPANGEEATIAAQFVAANAQAMDCLRLAREHAADLAKVLQCTAQSANMMRQARGARSLLLRVQAAREKREADSTATDKAAWIEHCAVGLMADALGREPPAPMAAPQPPPSAPEPEPEDEFRTLTEAEQYAVIYPRRAAVIRSLGGLPGKPDFDPPPPELVHAIVTGTSPVLRALATATGA
jgi:hypothetical protein